MDESIQNEYYEACCKYYFLRKIEDCEGFVDSRKDYFRGKKEAIEKIFINEEEKILQPLAKKAYQKAQDDYHFYF